VTPRDAPTHWACDCAKYDEWLDRIKDGKKPIGVPLAERFQARDATARRGYTRRKREGEKWR
jgi:hypothetical protein